MSDLVSDLFSTSTILIETFGAEGKRLCQATAFFYGGANGRLHLVTNWHVVTGRDPNTPSQSSTGAVPLVLRCRIHRLARRDDDGKFFFRPFAPVCLNLPINSEDGESPKWREHPEFGCIIDVVAIDVDDEFDRNEYAFTSVSENRGLDDRYRPSVMDDAFVVGFPLGISGSWSQSGAMPVFKRGSIASEPMLDFDGRPCLLIDCRSYSGMSGSPVLISHNGLWKPDGKDTEPGDTIIGTVRSFLGVYSGRLISRQPDQYEGVAEIGVVWKRSALEAVVNEGRPGTKLSEMS